MMKIFIVLTAVFFTSLAHADEIGTFDAWTAYSEMQEGSKVCFAASQPEKSEGDYKKRGDVFFLITRRSAERGAGEISVQTGYTYKKDAPVLVRIGKADFTLFSQDENAWATDAATDGKIINAMKGGNSMVVEGVSSRDTQTRDIYSLKGITAAYGAISKACGVK